MLYEERIEVLYKTCKPVNPDVPGGASFLNEVNGGEPSPEKEKPSELHSK